MEEKIRVGLIGTVGVPGRYGGMETLAHHLVLQLADTYDLTVYNSKQAYQSHERHPEWEGAKIVYIPLKANGIQSIPYDIISMLHAIHRNDVLIILGVSGCILLPFLKLFFPSKKLLVNIDGLEWRRPKWGKLAKAYLKLAERISVAFADEIVTDNQAITNYVIQEYESKSNLIAYGGDHTAPVESTESDFEKFPFLKGKYAMKVCRIEPENNVHVVLEAFEQYKAMPLVLVGNWDNSAYGRDLFRKYASHDHIFLFPPIYDPEMLNKFRSNSYVYLHGHEAGGTNPSLVEAMSLGLPVIAFDVNFNRESTLDEALYFKNANELAFHLKTLTQFKRDQLAENMETIASVQYSWKSIAKKYEKTIEQAMGGTEQINEPTLVQSYSK